MTFDLSTPAGVRSLTATLGITTQQLATLVDLADKPTTAILPPAVELAALHHKVPSGLLLAALGMVRLTSDELKVGRWVDMRKAPDQLLLDKACRLAVVVWTAVADSAAQAIHGTVRGVIKQGAV